MSLKTISLRLLILGTLVIWIIKFGLRPFYFPDGPFGFFLGVAPNLLGSFLIPFGAFWIFEGREHIIARIFKINSYTDLRIVCMMGFGLLVINEYLQLIPVFGRTFDVFDIYSSATGLLVSYFVFGKLYSRAMAV